MKLSLLFATAAAFAVGAAAAQAQAPAGYKVVKEVPLGAPERWDYVVYDAPSRRVYVAHSDRISVVDAKEGKLAAIVEIVDHRRVCFKESRIQHFVRFAAPFGDEEIRLA